MLLLQTFFHYGVIFLGCFSSESIKSENGLNFRISMDRLVENKFLKGQESFETPHIIQPKKLL